MDRFDHTCRSGVLVGYLNEFVSGAHKLEAALEDRIDALAQANDQRRRKHCDAHVQIQENLDPELDNPPTFQRSHFFPTRCPWNPNNRACCCGLMQAEVRNQMAIETVAMADVSTADVATFNDCERSVLGSDGNAGSWKLETHAALSDPGGHEHVLLNMARLSRIFPMAREDLSAMERGSCNAMFQRSQELSLLYPNISAEPDQL